MGRTASISLRTLQGLLAAVILALSAYVVNWYLEGTRRGSPASLNLLVFASCFSLLSILFLLLSPSVCPRAAHPYGALAVEALNALFYLAGFIAYAVFISRLTMCAGTVCKAGRADAVLAAIAFCAWTATTIFTAMGMFRGHSRKFQDSPVPRTEESSVEKLEANSVQKVQEEA